MNWLRTGVRERVSGGVVYLQDRGPHVQVKNYTIVILKYKLYNVIYLIWNIVGPDVRIKVSVIYCRYKNYVFNFRSVYFASNKKWLNEAY